MGGEEKGEEDPIQLNVCVVVVVGCAVCVCACVEVVGYPLLGSICLYGDCYV